MSETTTQQDTPGHQDTGSPGVVEVQQTCDQPVDAVWSRLTTPEGVEALLGEGARLGGKGEPWHAVDGSHGVTRSYHPGEQVRVSWHADEHAPMTMVDLQLHPAEGGSLLLLRHERLPAGAPTASLRQRWEEALTRLSR